VDGETAVRLAGKLPNHVVKVAESGIRSGEDVARLRAAGYDAFLIGETLMRAERPGAALRELVENADQSAGAEWKGTALGIPKADSSPGLLPGSE
jgi:pyridoxal biosynthesis lyase PdxS